MQANGDRHYYEPSKGHGLPHDPLKSIIGPRPIGWISSRGREGHLNLAPFSFFNVFADSPPIIAFASSGPKDTLRNAQETGEFVWNLATLELAERMNTTSATVSYETDEFALSGLTPVASRLVAPPRVAESPVNFECKVTEVLQLRDHLRRPMQSWVVFGEVVAVHILRALLKDGIFDTFGAGVVLRAGGPTGYAHIRPDNRFDMTRPR
jgi:flavin reductase (DIM6/NTAB) family NADH-FMN oxidoreductase RutF